MTETTAVAKTGITKLDVKALKDAHRVSFHFVDGKTTIRGSKKTKKTGPYEEREKQYDIESESTFSGIGGWKPHGCFAMLSTTHDTEWQTVVSFIKTGDEISLHWTANSNGYLDNSSVKEGHHAAGERLYRDELRLLIKRERSNKRYAFLIEVSICPDNSARMIRR
jgi:hypothetical protein